MTTALIRYWSFETGEDRQVFKSVVYPDGIQPGIPRGWYCWAYPSDDGDFVSWMEQHCPKAEVTHRFNGGDPMFTVHIKDEHEATVFQLKWMHHVKS